jgi:hypothetical protein
MHECLSKEGIFGLNGAASCMQSNIVIKNSRPEFIDLRTENYSVVNHAGISTG